MVDSPKKPEDSLSIEQAAFDAIERDFHEVLSELVGDRSLERFRHEYERLHRALKKSHENERRLIARVKELGSEIVANATKVKTALQLSQEDQATIASLRRETERMWRLVDGAHERESRAKDTITRLKAEISSLSKLVESSGGITLQEEGTIVDLLKHKQALRAEADVLKQQVDDLRAQVGDLTDRNRTLEQERLASESTVTKLREMAAQLKADSEREAARKAQFEARIGELESSSATTRAEIEETRTELQESEERRAELERTLRTTQATIETTTRQRSAAEAQTAKLQSELNVQLETTQRLQAESRELTSQVRERERQIRALEGQERRAQATLQKLETRLDASVRERDSVRARVSQLEQEVARREGDVAVAAREVAAERSRTSAVQRETDFLHRELRREGTVSDQAKAAAGVAELERGALEQEVQSYKNEAAKQRRIIHVLEQEREQTGADAARTASELQQAKEEIRLRELAISDLKARLRDSETRLEQQQQLYEDVRSDRNQFSRQLAQLEDELGELKREQSHVGLQLSQASEEIRAKDEALVKEHFERRRIEKSGARLRASLDSAQQRVGAAEETLTQQQAEIAKLNHIVAESRQRLQAREREHASTATERARALAEVQQRRTEIVVLSEKVRVVQSQLRNGEAAYLSRLRDIKLLRSRVRDLVRALQLAQKRGSAVEESRREILRLNKELLEERVKVRALSSELTNPLNVHRWRRLEGTDPSTFELLRKVQQLQRRLIQKTEAAAEKDAFILEKEEAYQQLKNAMARQPGVEVAGQLASYQALLAEKTKQLRAVTAEVTMHQGEVEELRHVIGKLETEMRSLKGRYYATRKRERAAAEAARSAGASGSADVLHDGRERFDLQPPDEGTQRFVGGGFNVTATVPRQRTQTRAEPGTAEAGLELLAAQLNPDAAGLRLPGPEAEAEVA